MRALAALGSRQRHAVLKRLTDCRYKTHCHVGQFQKHAKKLEELLKGATTATAAIAFGEPRLR